MVRLCVMRSTTAICILLLCTLTYSFISIAEVSAQEAEEAQKRGKHITARQLITAAIEDLRKRGIGAESQALSERILENPAAHRLRTKSEDLLRDWMKNQLESKLENQLSRIYSEVNKEKEWITRPEWNKIVPDLDRTIQDVVSAGFSPVYQTALGI